jgi:hypothetical protein
VNLLAKNDQANSPPPCRSKKKTTSVPYPLRQEPLALALQTSRKETVGRIYVEGKQLMKTLFNKLQHKLTHRYCASNVELMAAFELGMKSGRITEKMTLLAELTAVGSKGDNFEMPMADFLDIFDPTKDKKKD